MGVAHPSLDGPYESPAQSQWLLYQIGADAPPLNVADIFDLIRPSDVACYYRWRVHLSYA